MILPVNATRMQLLGLKRKVAIARRGHKLLKDKQDVLMRKFMATIEGSKSLRLEVCDSLKNIFRDFIRARSIKEASAIDAQLVAKETTLEIEQAKEVFLNLSIPRFKIINIPQGPSYSFFNTTSDLDLSLNNFKKIIPKMIELAEFEIKIKLLAEEIKKTRRRVNALEYILIPNLVDTIKYINMKLTELERSNLTRLMRVKEMIEARH